MICAFVAFMYAHQAVNGVRYTAGVCAYECPTEVEEIKYTFALIQPHLGEAGCAREQPHHYIKEARGSAGAAPLRAELESRERPPSDREHSRCEADDPHDPMWYE